MPFAELKAGRFHYKDSGGDFPVVVFAHGFLLDHEMFELQVAEIQRDHRCVVWDQRCHGRTEVCGPHSLWDSARDELELMDLLGVEDFFHVGMSQGGFIGLRVALEAPRRVRGLIMIDSQAGPEDPATLPMYEAMVGAWEADEDREGLARTTAQIILGPGIDPDYWVDKWLALDPDRLPEAFRTLVGREDLHSRLSEIDVPALVVHGTEDVAIPMSLAERLAEGLKAGPVVKVQGAGHSANLFDPLSVNKALEGFLARHGAGPV